MIKVSEVKKRGNETVKKLAECEVGTPVKFDGDVGIIIEKNCHTVDVISVDFGRKVRLSSNLQLPVAPGGLSMIINW